jgi:hypothetical protein
VLQNDLEEGLHWLFFEHGIPALPFTWLPLRPLAAIAMLGAVIERITGIASPTPAPVSTLLRNITRRETPSAPTGTGTNPTRSLASESRPSASARS